MSQKIIGKKVELSGVITYERLTYLDEKKHETNRAKAQKEWLKTNKAWWL